MPLDNAENFAVDFLDGAVASGDTIITVLDASVFPDTPFRITVWDSSNFDNPSSDPDVEIMLCTSISGNDLSVDRGMENTTASSHDDGENVENDLTAQMLDQIQTEIDNAGGGGGGGQTLYDTIVAADGSGDYTSFANAISNASDDESIYVKNGTYSESGQYQLGANNVSIRGESRVGVKIEWTIGSNEQWAIYFFGDQGWFWENLSLWCISADNSGSQILQFWGANHGVSATHILNCDIVYIDDSEPSGAIIESLGSQDFNIQGSTIAVPHGYSINDSTVPAVLLSGGGLQNSVVSHFGNSHCVQINGAGIITGNRLYNEGASNFSDDSSGGSAFIGSNLESTSSTRPYRNASA